MLTVMDDIVKSIVGELEKYFSNSTDIAFAYLFGSRVSGNSVDESDFDVAVYFYPVNGELQVETDASFTREAAVWNEIEQITGTETDLVILNRAPAIVAASVFYSGIPVYIDDHKLKWRYFLTVMSLAEEYRDFARDFREIKIRSTSLSESDRDRLLRIIDFLEMELHDASSFNQFNRASYFGDSGFRRNAERWVENLVNASIDIAKILISSEKQNIPQTYRETILRLNTFPAFKEEDSEVLAGFVKLRNVLAHEYLDLKYKEISRFIETAPEVYQQFVGKVKHILGLQRIDEH